MVALSAATGVVFSCPAGMLRQFLLMSLARTIIFATSSTCRPATAARRLSFLHLDQKLARSIPMRASSSSSASERPPLIPRAAVAVVVRWKDTTPTSDPRWLLVQRGKEPNMGMWSLPGGKIEAGEGTLQGAKRELAEETGLTAEGGALSYELRWHDEGPFTCSDSIHLSEGPSFHYVISQCFAEVAAPSSPEIEAADDAMDAQWWSSEEVKVGEDDGSVSRGVLKVIDRAELLYARGLLECN